METDILHKKIIECILTIVLVIALSLTFSCGSDDTAEDSEESESETTEAFPSALAVSSPFDTVASDSTSARVSAKVVASGISARVPRYTRATLEIEALLSGTSTSLCTFDPEQFLTETTDAGCYGPTVQYENHPDHSGSGSNDGQLPGGDVGLWSEEDSGTGHACAAAELNARMEGVSDKATESLMGLASMICVINANGYSMPSSSTLDLTADMNALGYADTTFGTATISHAVNSDGDDEYSYILDFTYAPGSDSYDITVEMAHIPGAGAGAYRGRMSYLINNQGSGGNCHSSDITENASFLYERDAIEDISIELRHASFCEHDSDGRVDGIVDAGDKYDATSNQNGWSDNFSILTADYDPVTLAGAYTYSWQAGPLDGAARTFNLSVAVDSSGDQSAEAFFGYGDDIEDTDGSIGGFICNWAGPNSNHSLEAAVQHQSMSLDSSTGLVTASDNDLLYAPTNSCDYSGTGTFTYDSDTDAVVDTNPLTAIANELLPVVDSDANGSFDEIEDAGFTLPVPPTNL